jgi:hypothetical protein
MPPDAGHQTPLQEPTPGYIALPYLLAFWALTFLLGLILAPTVDLRTLLNPRDSDFVVVQILFQFGLLVCIGAGILVHFRPNHSRQLKYSLVMAGLPVLHLFLEPRSILDTLEQAFPDRSVSFLRVALFFCVVFWSILLVGIVAVLGGMWIRRQASAAQTIPRAWEQFLFTLVHVRIAGPVFLILVPLSKGLLLVLLMIRYLTGERFRRQPVIYLRSFHYDAAAEVFGEAIAPALAPFGVIKGLVHGEQTSGDLFSRTSIWQFGFMATIPDARWRDWVKDALSSASLAIIDRSVPTESVTWEVDTALHLIDKRRVLILSRDQTSINTTPDVKIVKYGQEPDAMTRLRRDIGSWAGRTLAGGQSKMLVANAVLICVTLLAVVLEFALGFLLVGFSFLKAKGLQ